MSTPAPALGPLEVATGVVVGAAAGPAPLLTAGGRTPLQALEDAIRPHLRASGPCVVSYSGGRDSTLLLTVAAGLAAREGLPAPVAATLRFPADPDAEETAWQELGVRDLTLTDWVRHEVTAGELDLLGPAATDLLRRHGLTWPYNLHFHAPLMPVARAGSLLVGFDGDGVLDGWRWAPAADYLARRQPLRPHAVRVVGLSRAPTAVREAVIARREVERLPWLTPAAAREDVRTWAAEVAAEPRTWPERLRWFAHRRHLALTRASFALLGAHDGVDVAFPLLDPGFLGALARCGGRWGFRDRTDVLIRGLPGVLAPALAQRRTKASFDGAFWGPQARAFVDGWDGTGVDTGLVDPVRLAAAWSTQRPHAMTCQLVQSAWLAARSRQAGEQRGGCGH